MRLPYANVKIRHWNPGASKPLVLPVHLVCNTSDEEIYSNIRENSASRGNWLRLAPDHDRTAVLCGSGPSLADHLGVIRERQAAGQTVFALNGAARFLADNGILPDYQVIIDAREATADLVGPALNHLFASQVHPECFRRAPDAQLWHLEVGNIENEFPDYPNDYCLIGGAASVGNTATCLAFAMGYRNLQLYGYDSSHRNDKGHAFAQPMNDGDPCCVVKFDGKEYTASLTMKLQAEKFQETAAALKASGCTIEVHGDGLLPAMFKAPPEVMAEEEKYQRIWEMDAYRNLAPGEECVPKFLELIAPGATVIDFGCGTGRAALKIATAGHQVTLLDFADNCRDKDAESLPFIKWDLTRPIEVKATYGFCTDVMEHIPPLDVEAVITNIMRAAPRTFFNISTVPDELGVLIGQHLHLTVRPHKWWRETFQALGYHITWQEMTDVASSFFVVDLRRDNPTNWE
jgi:SAM-dependent methyltransferase